MRQLGIRLLNITLVALCCFLVARVVNGVAADSLAAEPTYTVSDLTETEATQSAWNERKAILDRNLFGAKIVAEAPPPPPKEETVEETKLPLTLEATLAGSHPSDSRATIRDTRARASMVLAVGDELDNHPQVRIASIERRRVVLDNRGRIESLLLYDGPSTPDTGARKATSRVSKAKAKPRRSPRRSRQSRASKPSEERLEELRELSEQVQAGDFSMDDLGARLAEMQAEDAENARYDDFEE